MGIYKPYVRPHLDCGNAIFDEDYNESFHQKVESIQYCCFSYAGNWELVKSIVGTKFRRSHVCLHSQTGNRL